MRVAVIGSGIAGMAAALALDRRGHAVTLVEAFDTPQPLGSGLLLQPSGLAALRVLGLYEPVVGLGARIEALDGRDLSGRRIMDMRYADWRPDGFGLGVHRATLFSVLHDAVMASNVEQRPATEIVGIEDWSRPLLRDAGGRAHGPYDAAVVADGSGSDLRALVRPTARAPLYPYGAVWANARDVSDSFAGSLHQRYHRASLMAGILPIGAGPNGEGGLVSFFWSLPVARMDGFLAGDLGAWRAELIRIWPETEPIVAQFDAPADFARATYRDVRVGRWTRGAVTLIGDAAHGTSPQLGQGGNLALIDAVELAWRLEAPVARSLGGFQAARRRHTGFYQFASRWLTPLFQSAGPVWPWVRDYLFTPLSRAPGGRWLAALVLTGMLRLGRTPPDLRP